MTDDRQDHYLLDGRAGWREAKLERTSLRGDPGSLGLSLVPGAGKPLVDSAGGFGALSLPTGVAVDRFDRVYLLDGDLVKRFDRCAGQFEILDCLGGRGSGPRRLREPRGIAISCRDNIYIADTGNSRVQVFGLKGLALRGIWGPYIVNEDAAGIRVEAAKPELFRPAAPDCPPEWRPPAKSWQPWDVAVSRENCVYVSDYANGLIHVFDCDGCWQRAYIGESAAARLQKPTALALDREGRIFVLQEGRSFVTILNADGSFAGKVEKDVEVDTEFCPISIAVDDQGNLLLGERHTGRLHFLCRVQCGEYRCATDCGSIGSPAALAFDNRGNAIAVDAARKLAFLLEPHAAYQTDGTFVSAALDSGIYRCNWHRVQLACRIPAGTRVRVDTFTSEAERTLLDIQSLPEDRWRTGISHSQVGEGHWDCLILSPPGRILWLRLTLFGDGATTPRIDEARVYFPRETSAQYLPAAYREDPISGGFVERFLAIFDSVRGGIRNRVDDFAGSLDPCGAPADDVERKADFLSWLAGWMGLALDRHWPVGKRRRLLKNIYRLYELRGTPEGLRLHICLYTGQEPRILEHFKLRRWLFVGHGGLGDQTTVWGDAIANRLQLGVRSRISEFQLIDSGDPLRDPFHAYAHKFTVFLPQRREWSDTERQTLDRIVEMAKPAHTSGEVAAGDPHFRIGIRSFLGIDTVITDYPDVATLGGTRLGRDSMVGMGPDEAAGPTQRLGINTRIGAGTLID